MLIIVIFSFFWDKETYTYTITYTYTYFLLTGTFYNSHRFPFGRILTEIWGRFLVLNVCYGSASAYRKNVCSPSVKTVKPAMDRSAVTWMTMREGNGVRLKLTRTKSTCPANTSTVTVRLYTIFIRTIL